MVEAMLIISLEAMLIISRYAINYVPYEEPHLG